MSTISDTVLASSDRTAWACPSDRLVPQRTRGPFVDFPKISPLRQVRTRHMLGRSRVLLYTLSALTPQRARPVRSASSLLNRFAWYCAGARWRGFHQRYPQVSTKPLILLLKEHHSRHSQEVKTDPLRKCHNLLFRAFSSHFRTASRFDLASNCFSTPIILLDHFIRVNTPTPEIHITETAHA